MSLVPFHPPGPGPFGHAAAITPSDTVPLPTPASSIWVGSVGDVTLIPAGQTTSVLFAAVPSGTLLPIAASQVLATGTTASSLAAMY